MDTVCSNCRGSVRDDEQALFVTQNDNRVAILCSTCQQAKKIRVTLERNSDGRWIFSQYFPVEA